MNKRKQRIEALFDAVLELTSPEQREIYLSRASADDPQLRREVEELIRAHEQAGGFLMGLSDEPTEGSSGVAPSAKPDMTLSERVGDKIGRYKLLEKIGEGGMGVVYMAEQQ